MTEREYFVSEYQEDELSENREWNAKTMSYADCEVCGGEGYAGGEVDGCPDCLKRRVAELEAELGLRMAQIDGMTVRIHDAEDARDTLREQNGRLRADLEQEIWNHAACLSIAEGQALPPEHLQSQAMRAVADLYIQRNAFRQQRDSLRAQNAALRAGLEKISRQSVTLAGPMSAWSASDLAWSDAYNACAKIADDALAASESAGNEAHDSGDGQKG